MAWREGRLSQSDLRKVHYNKGESIFREGDPGDAAYIVEAGSVGIFKTVEGERIHLATLTSGELFGEMAIIDGSRRMAEAVALENSILRSIPADLLEDKLEKYDRFLKALIKILVNNLRNVHKMYMKRPRSLEDYVNALAFHLSGLRDYLDAVRDAPLQERALAQIENVEVALGVLRAMFQDHQDRRRNALGESDLPQPPDKT